MQISSRTILVFVAVTATCAIVLGLIALRHPVSLMGVAYGLRSLPPAATPLVGMDSAQLARQLTATQRRVGQLQRRIEGLTPANPFLVVNTTANTFELRTRREVLRRGICSTGSYVLLKGQDDQRWLFRTPKGQFRILNKLVDPLWVKPDWAFVGEGLPVPPRNHPDRFEYGTLGEYALNLGQGYLIHGTLYERFLGLPVTHGCIRLGDDDLEAVFYSLDVGSRVYIF